MKALLVTLSLLLAPAAHAQWYSGGGLHRATGAQWKSATDANRLATSADFAAAALGPNKMKSLGSMDRLRPYANNVKSCIDETVAGQAGDALRVSEIGAICWRLLRY